jgi:hypothetical protein
MMCSIGVKSFLVEGMNPSDWPIELHLRCGFQEQGCSVRVLGFINLFENQRSYQHGDSFISQKLDIIVASRL